MSIKFKTSPQGIKITTYQPTNIKFEYENKLYRIEIYIEEPAENTKVKGDKEKKYKPEENNMYFVTTKGKHVYSESNYSKMDEVF